MSEEKEIIYVPVPLHVVQKEARYSRTMKQILGKFAKENNLPGSNKVFEVSTDHNKSYELAEKKAKLEKEQEEIDKAEAVKAEKLEKLPAKFDKAELKAEHAADVETVKAKNATDNKKRS